MYHIKNDKRSLSSHMRIYKALKEIMEQKDFNEISVIEVVEHAEVGRATFYRNFDKLEDVLRYEIDTRFDDLYKYLKEYYKSEPKYFMSFFIVPFFRYWYVDSEPIELLIKAKKTHMLLRAFENLIMRGIEEYDGDDPIITENLNYFIAIRTGIAINLLIEWIKNDKQPDSDQLLKMVMGQLESDTHKNMFRKP